MNRTAFTALICVLAMACSEPVPSSDLDGVEEQGVRVQDGTPEALGMLDFLNDASTTFELLDDQVGLDRRAAEALIAHRDGPDGVLGWLSDDLFDDIAEVDAQYYVGTSALTKIETWAVDHDWVALGPDDVLGSWDGVEFTVAEAEATIELANTTGRNYLDDDLGLDSRAVDSIFAARPILSVAELADLYYVGASALNTLKDASTGTPDCAVEGWDTQYIYDEGDDAWRSQLPAEYVAVVDEVVLNDAWCGEANGDAWFVKATVDLFNCVEKGYTIELGQDMLEYPGVTWYIEFEVDENFDWFLSTCEV